MIKIVDSILNKITMYRLMLYYLIFLFVIALGLSFFRTLPYSPLFLLFSTIFILFICFVTNLVFSKIFKVPANVESVYITAFILVLIITPLKSFAETTYFSLAFWASFWAMASKYLLTIRKKHIFNPAAFGVALTSVALGQSASWWIGTGVMAPFVLIGGLLVVKKILRSDLVYSFILVALATILASHLNNTSFNSLVSMTYRTLTSSSLLFFAFVMITEPLTTPPRAWSQMSYGVLVGFLFAPAIHIGSVYSTPELALLAGNIFSYIVGSKDRLVLTLKERVPISPDVYDFVFTSDQKISFQAGQYLEWTLDVKSPDSRGNRRYFTVASSPTEPEIRLGVKSYPKPSTFKRDLFSLRTGDKIFASQLSGDFTLPKDKNRKLVFIAGGIGVTPFRSIVKFLMNKGEKRDITIFFSNKTPRDIIYKDIFDEALQKIGIKIIYAVNELADLSAQAGETASLDMRVGFIDADMIMKEVPDYRERYYYISGPHSMVVVFEETLRKMGISNRQIKVDFFPGFV